MKPEAKRLPRAAGRRCFVDQLGDELSVVRL